MVQQSPFLGEFEHFRYEGWTVPPSHNLKKHVLLCYISNSSTQPENYDKQLKAKLSESLKNGIQILLGQVALDLLIKKKTLFCMLQSITQLQEPLGLLKP